MPDQVMVPEFPTVRIGKRKSNQKVIEILPLSWHDAKKLQETFVKLLQTCGAMVMENKPEADIYRFVFVALCDSVETILPYITDVEVDAKDIHNGRNLFCYECEKTCTKLMDKLNLERMA